MCLDNGMDIRTLSSVLGFQNVKTVKNAYEKAEIENEKNRKTFKFKIAYQYSNAK